MSKGARLFVFTMFSIMGASFFATTGVLIWEFGDPVWLSLASMDSHLFVFFPTMGIVALVAFFVPASVFVDLYWKEKSLGRFLFGLVVVALASYLISQHILAGTNRSLWEVAPGALRADAGDPPGCATQGPVCQRMPLLSALINLRQVSRNHLGLAGFNRDCSVTAADPLIEPSQQAQAKRFCFASTPLTAAPPVLQSDTECCKAQALLVSTVRDYYSQPSERSMTAATHAALLPLKVFFLLVVLLISVLLAVHHKKLESEESHYKKHMLRIEVGLLVGSISMLFFPLMSEAYIQSAGGLFGIAARGPFATMMPIVSFLFLIWALLTGLFFYRRKANERLVSAARMGGVVVSNIGIIKYNLLIAAVAWALGAGASNLGLLALIAGCFVAVAAVAGVRKPLIDRD